MFSKKNIAKLLVFAMIFTMLPVSTVGADGGKALASQVTSADYSIQPATVVVTGSDGDKLSFGETNWTISGNGKSPSSAYTIEYDVSADTTPKPKDYVIVDNAEDTVKVKFTVGDTVKSVYNVDEDTDKKDLNGSQEVEFDISLPAEVNSNSPTPVTAKFCAYVTASDTETRDMELNKEYYNIVFNVQKAAPTKYNVTVETPENGTLSADLQEAAENETVTLTVEPAEGYKTGRVYYIAADTSSTEKIVNADSNGEYKFNMPAANVTVNATFTKNTTYVYKIEKDTTVEVPAELLPGETVTLKANVLSKASDAEEYVEAKGVKIEWSSDSNAATVDADGNVQAAADLTVDTTVTITATATAEDGTALAAEEGETTTISWTFTVKAKQTGDYSITINATTGGTVRSDKAYANESDTVTLTVDPAYGFRYDTMVIAYSVSDDTVPFDLTENEDGTYTATFTMPNSDVTVTATFVPASTTRTVTVNMTGDDADKAIEAGAKVELDKDAYNPGETVTLNIYRPTGYDIKSVLIGDKELSVTKVDQHNYNCTFEMPEENVEVNVTFDYREPTKNAKISVGKGDNWLDSELVIDGTIEGKWYVFTLQTIVKGNISTSYMALQADETGVLRTPFNPGTILTIKETNGVTTNDMKVLPIVEDVTSLGWSVNGRERTDDEILNAYVSNSTGSDSTSTGSNTVKVDKGDNWLGSKLVIDGTIEGKWYVFTLQTIVQGNISTSYMALQADGTGILETPFNPGTILTIKETDGVSTGDMRVPAIVEDGTSMGWNAPISRKD